MSFGSYSEEEIMRIAQRYDPTRKWQLNEERSGRGIRIYVAMDKENGIGGFLKIHIVRPSFLFVERWDGGGKCAVSAVYEKTDGGIKRLMSKRNRGRELFPESLFPDRETIEETAAHDDTVKYGGFTTHP